MIKVDHIEVFNFEGAIRGMRNPLNSWAKSDSYYGFDCKKCKLQNEEGTCMPLDGLCDKYPGFVVGPNDLGLMKKLYKAGPEHRKFMRQLMISMDIESNQPWWLQFDTMKVGITKNSCSKMHKIHVKEFDKEDFSCEGIIECGGMVSDCFGEVLNTLEFLRNTFNATGEKKYWRAMIELLPSGYNLRATVTMNYENAVTIIRQRTGHKMFEWNEFVKVLKDLPYMKEIIGEENE